MDESDVLGATDPITRVVVGALTPEEREQGVAYLRSEILRTGQMVPVSGPDLTAGVDSYVAFVDPTPSANWGHDCRYLFIDVDALTVESKSARFPPFRAQREGRWKVIHRAPGVPDTLVDGQEGRNQP